MMAEYTDDDVTRLAEMLASVHSSWALGTAARRLLEQGVTLPPPPPDDTPPENAFVVAGAIRFAYLGSEDLPMDEQWPGHARMVAAVRDLFPPEALAAAAAKVQEADR